MGESDRMPTPLIETPVLERTLRAALRSGGDFAGGVRGGPAGKQRSLRRRPRRGAHDGSLAGRRHPRRPRRHDRVRAHRRSGRGRPRRSGRGRGGRRARRGWWRARGRARPACRRRRTTSRCCPSRYRRPARSSCCGAPTPRPAPRVESIRSVTASYADSRRRILVANSDGLLTDDDQVRTRFGVQTVAAGDTGMQTGYEAPGRTLGFEYFDEFDVDRDRAHVGAPRDHDARRPARAERHAAGRARAGRGSRALPRGVRPRSRGRPRAAGRVGVRRARSASRSRRRS